MLRGPAGPEVITQLFDGSEMVQLIAFPSLTETVPVGAGLEGGSAITSTVVVNGCPDSDGSGDTLEITAVTVFLTTLIALVENDELEVNIVESAGV